MRRLVSQHRLATAVAFLVFFTGSAILLKPHVARAFTLISSTIYFDPVSLTPAQTLHVHVVNQLGTTPIGIFVTLKPTTPGLGSAVSGAAVTLSPGDGADQSFPFASLSPTPGTTRIPVVCTIAAVAIPPGAPLPSDFSARTASSVEIIDDVTGRPTEITTTHHIVNATTGPCAFCN
ncbi:MAG TPA: hypothetical protein VII12_09545 [Thermoanaerobaculia bacterium]